MFLALQVFRIGDSLFILGIRSLPFSGRKGNADLTALRRLDSFAVLIGKRQVHRMDRDHFAFHRLRDAVDHILVRDHGRFHGRSFGECVGIGFNMDKGLRLAVFVFCFSIKGDGIDVAFARINFTLVFFPRMRRNIPLLLIITHADTGHCLRCVLLKGDGRKYKGICSCECHDNCKRKCNCSSQSILKKHIEQLS